MPPRTFADLTTLRVGGPIGDYVEARSEDELVEHIRSADAAGRELLILGGGSNVVVGDDGFDGTVLRPVECVIQSGGDGALWFSAGYDWDAAVRESLDAGYTGLEALSGIPGTAGASPIQNVGAYGGLTSDTLAQLTVYDRATGEVEVWGNEQCGFGPHRESIFKHSKRWVILSVGFLLSRDPTSPVRYQSLADELAVPLGARVPAPEIREAVLALRRKRGMVLDATDHDTWSVGSFFLNPVVRVVPDAAKDAPQWADPGGTKLSAAWLIERSGFARGYGNDRVSLSTKHTLALTNRGGAMAEDVLALAREIRERVEAAFGVRLEPECRLVNCEL